jgi:hypothetical protein
MSAASAKTVNPYFRLPEQVADLVISSTSIAKVALKLVFYLLKLDRGRMRPLFLNMSDISRKLHCGRNRAAGGITTLLDMGLITYDQDADRYMLSDLFKIENRTEATVYAAKMDEAEQPVAVEVELVAQEEPAKAVYPDFIAERYDDHVVLRRDKVSCFGEFVAALEHGFEAENMPLNITNDSRMLAKCKTAYEGKLKGITVREAVLMASRSHEIYLSLPSHDNDFTFDLAESFFSRALQKLRARDAEIKAEKRRQERAERREAEENARAHLINGELLRECCIQPQVMAVNL